MNQKSNSARVHFAARWRRGMLAAGLAGGLALGLAPGSQAQTAQPMEIIVPFGTGGGADEVARFAAPLLEAEAQAPVKVTNVPGATGNIGIARLLAAPSDGRTLAVLTGDTYASVAYFNAAWSPNDVIPLAILTRQSSALFVSARSPFANWQDFAAQARKTPRTLRVAISGYGSPDYIALEQMGAKGIRLAPLPLDNPQERYQAVLDGLADALYEQPGDVRNFVDAGQMRPLLMFSAARVPEFKDVPASGEIGLGNGLPQFRAVVVKRGTDPQIVKTLTEAFGRIASTPEYKTFIARQMAAADSFVPGGNARAFMLGQMDVMKQVVIGLPLHARFPLDDKSPEELPPQF